jgi:hypothetical protein
MFMRLFRCVFLTLPVRHHDTHYGLHIPLPFSHPLVVVPLRDLDRSVTGIWLIISVDTL